MGLRKRTLLTEALASCSSHFASAALFSMGVNLLFLTPTIYMIQISDRVLSSGSKDTLVFLTLAFVLAILTLSLLDFVRSKVLIRAGLRLDRRVSLPLMTLMLEHANANSLPNQERDQAMWALDTFRSFITGSGIHTLFDLPWLPLYLVTLFLVHPMVGGISVAFMVVQVVVTIATERLLQDPIARSQGARMRSYALAGQALRNAEVVAGMGMGEAVLEPWQRDRKVMLTNHAIASDRNAMMSSIGKFLRLFVQGLIVGVGAYYVLERDITAGAMVAGMLLVARASQPLDQVLSIWKMLTDVREAYRRLNDILLAPPPRATLTVLPKPTGILTVDKLTYVPPRYARPVLADISFSLVPGTCLGVIGPSAAGKSTLARLLVGVHRPSEGVVRLDGADVFGWDRAQFGEFVGYLPQDIELFAGTVAQNIARFQDAEAKDILHAARRAGAHDMIIKLPQGYETAIGDNGAILSGGQRQQVGLARAVFGDPRLVVLDEPNSNLDSDGEAALRACILQLKEARTTVVLISHRPSTLELVDRILYLAEGRAVRILTKTEFFDKLNRAAGQGAAS